MKVTLHNSCFNYFPTCCSKETLEEFKSKALDAWNKRGKEEKSTRFIMQIPSQQGQRYHFFTVSLYRNRTDLLSIRE